MMHRSATHDADVAAVGRHGTLELTFASRDGRTYLSHHAAFSPWHFLPATSLDGDVAYINLVNPSGGLVGGDRVTVEVITGPETRVLCSTPSANRVYRSLSERAEQIIRVHVGRDAVLEWVPELTIPYAGARFSQRVHVTLEQLAGLVLWDAIAAGRVARGERWAFTEFENEILVQTVAGSLCERYIIKSRPEPHRGIGIIGDWNYVGTLYLVSDGIGEETWKRLEESIGEVLENRQGRVLGGVSEPAVRGLIVKLLAKSAPDLNSVFETVWAAARAQLWGLPFPALRRY